MTKNDQIHVARINIDCDCCKARSKNKKQGNDVPIIVVNRAVKMKQRSLQWKDQDKVKRII